MPPSFVLNVVAKSGLVAREVLLDVFNSQAVRAEKNGRLTLRKRIESTYPKWCSTGSLECDSSSCRSIRFLDRSVSSGCWTWTILAEKILPHLGVGFIQTKTDVVVGKEKAIGQDGDNMY